jgi:cytosine/adenosine deaminase-related metal-dependent hydrolase
MSELRYEELEAAGLSRPDEVDLLISGADLVVTMDQAVEIPGGWVAVRDGRIAAIGNAGTEPPARQVLRANGCLVTPGLINTHHHMFQNLTRSYAPSTRATLFGWLTTLYPLWSRLDEESVYLSAWIGLAELALGGCTTSTDHLYVHPAGAADLISAEIQAATELGMRFHPTRGSMSVSEKDGGLPPDSVVEDEDRILAESERLVAQFHDPSPDSMVRLALAPCSPFSVSTRLMTATAELAERLDVRLHTHFAEDPDEDAYCLAAYGLRPYELLEQVGWAGSRAWVAHCVYPSGSEITKLAAAGVAVAHCPSSNMMIAQGLAPIGELRDAGVAVGLGCDGSSSTDSASLWLEARTAMLCARLRQGPDAIGARDALEIATLGGAECLGRAGEIGVLRPGAAADLVCWPLEGIPFAGALTDPVEAWLRCGPSAARHTVVAGRVLVEDGALRVGGVEEMLRRHRLAAKRIQNLED